MDGEREAARRAAERIRAQLAEIRGYEQDEVLVYSLPDPWKRKLFPGAVSALRADAVPRGRPSVQHRDGACAEPKTFQHKTLWPEFLALSEELHTHLLELTERVICEAINEDTTEASEGAPKALPEDSGT